MKIKFTAYDKEFNMELNEAIEKMLSTGTNEIKHSVHYAPQGLAQQILTNENIDADFINSNFEKWNRSARYSLMRYCFDKLNEKNKYFGFFDLELNRYSHSNTKLSKHLLVDAIGEDNYYKYNKLVNFIKTVNIDEYDFPESEIMFFKKCFKMLSVYDFEKYLQFMQKYNLKVNVEFYQLYRIMDNVNSKAALKYLSSITLKKKINIFKEAIRHEFYKDKFIKFYNANNDNSFNEFLALNNI